jgi:hypothetical protein
LGQKGSRKKEKKKGWTERVSSREKADQPQLRRRVVNLDLMIPLRRRERGKRWMERAEGRRLVACLAVVGGAIEKRD